jgi:transporter family-2 protein
LQWLLSPVAILSGMLMVVQSACNGMLEKIIDRPVTVAVISLSVGISTLLVGGVFFGQLGFPTGGKAMQGAWWAWLGGVCGAVALLSQPLAVPRLGAAMYIGLFVTSSVVLSVLFDHFAPDGHTSNNRVDFDSVTLHELGHALGLGHSPNVRQAVMYPYFAFGEERRKLSQDDIDGITTLYGPR